MHRTRRPVGLRSLLGLFIFSPLLLLAALLLLTDTVPGLEPG